MNETKYRKAYRELLAKTIKSLRKYEQTALDSGALDLESDKSSYRTPKDVITAALRDEADRWAPFHSDRKGAKRVRNIQALTYN